MRSNLLQRKCACGGTPGPTGECREKGRFDLQAKLKINDPGDIYEQEAGRIADQVLAAPIHSSVSVPLPIRHLSGQTNGQIGSAPRSVDAALASPGMPLESAFRQDMEQRFGYDFSKVRVHSGSTAEQSAQDVNANAYTVGQNIVFGAGRFAPRTDEGRRLLAHGTDTCSPATCQEFTNHCRPAAAASVPKPGHTPFNFISESPALENWKVAVKEMLQREFKTRFATFKEAQQRFRQHLESLPSDSAREEFADRMRDRARKAFYRQEARNPSYTYDPGRTLPKCETGPLRRAECS